MSNSFIIRKRHLSWGNLALYLPFLCEYDSMYDNLDIYIYYIYILINVDIIWVCESKRQHPKIPNKWIELVFGLDVYLAILGVQVWTHNPEAVEAPTRIDSGLPAASLATCVSGAIPPNERGLNMS